MGRGVLLLSFIFIFCYFWHPLTTYWTLFWGFWVKSLRWVLFSSRNRWLAHLRSNLWWGQTWQRSIWKFFLVCLSAEWRQCNELNCKGSFVIKITYLIWTHACWHLVKLLWQSFWGSRELILGRTLHTFRSHVHINTHQKLQYTRTHEYSDDNTDA